MWNKYSTPGESYSYSWVVIPNEPKISIFPGDRQTSFPPLANRTDITDIAKVEYRRPTIEARTILLKPEQWCNRLEGRISVIGSSIIRMSNHFNFSIYIPCSVIQIKYLLAEYLFSRVETGIIHRAIFIF